MNHNLKQTIENFKRKQRALQIATKTQCTAYHNTYARIVWAVQCVTADKTCDHCHRHYKQFLPYHKCTRVVFLLPLYNRRFFQCEDRHSNEQPPPRSPSFPFSPHQVLNGPHVRYSVLAEMYVQACAIRHSGKSRVRAKRKTFPHTSQRKKHISVCV